MPINNSAPPSYNQATGLPTYTQAMATDSAPNHSNNPNRIADAVVTVGNKGSQASRGMSFLGAMNTSRSKHK